MRITRRELLAFLAFRASAQKEGVADDVVLRAMRDEMARLKQLRASTDPPYYVEYALDDLESYSVSATFGGLLHERPTKVRLPRVTVRVGTPEMDNTNYVFSGFYSGSRFDPENFPLDDNYEALRQGFWLATDRAYKGAIEAIGRKRAALRNITQTDSLPDFSAAPPVVQQGDLSREAVDQEGWRARAISLSAIFNSYPEIQESGVEVDCGQSRSYFLSSEGSAVTFLDALAYVRIQGRGQAADGMLLRNHAQVNALQSARLPGEAELRQIATTVASDLKSMLAAPVGESVVGPVLFDAGAGAQLFAELLSGALPATRKPVGQPGRPLPYRPGIFEGRIGSRVLPDTFTVVDDPTQREWRGQPLLGHYRADMEAVVPEPLTVIENGVLKSLLSTRQPTRDTKASNGRARLPGAFGAKIAAISNLFVQSSEAVPAKALKDQLLKMISDRGKPYGMIIRKMDFPSSASTSELRRLIQGQEHPISLPLLAYRVFADGREELVRGLRFRNLNARTLKDIITAGDDLQAFHFLGSPAPFSLVGGSNYVYTSTVVAPSILFEDLELERLDQDLPQLPLVPPPPLTR